MDQKVEPLIREQCYIAGLVQVPWREVFAEMKSRVRGGLRS